MKRYLELGQVLTLLLILLFAVIAFKKSGIIFKEKKEETIEFLDYDKDGINDQEEILNGAKKILEVNNNELENDYVFTDIIWLSLKEAGYDFVEMINKDINDNQKRYRIDIPNDKIDYRNYENIKIYFENNVKRIENQDYIPGDIVFYKENIGIISDKKNKNDEYYIIYIDNHKGYEEDILLNENINYHYRFIIK